MRRIVLLTTLSILAACSGGTSAKEAAAQEQAELAACQATYPERPGLFGARARCELGAAGNYVQLTDPGEDPRMTRLADQLGADAAAVDTGSSTADQWHSKLEAAVDALPDRDKRIKQGAGALL